MPRFPRTRAEVTLDGPTWIGQRSTSWRFDLVDAVTGYRRPIYPIISGNAGIRHDTRQTIKRTISGVTLSPADTALFSSISSRLEPFFLVGDEEFQVGRYVPSDWARFPLSSGTMSSASFYDEGFIVDQQITNAFGAVTESGEIVSSMLQRFLKSYPIEYFLEAVHPDYVSLSSWSAGTRGGFILDQLALEGDYQSPWFDNRSVLQIRRAIDPNHEIPTFDFDAGQVSSASIVESDNLIQAPNRYVVVGNGAESLGKSIVGVADVASSAPHSIANRGFIVPEVLNRQVTSSEQAAAIASNLARNQNLVEQVELDTPPDPRHDGYDIVLWRGQRWVEMAWTLPFSQTASMSHTLRRVYDD